MAPLRARLADVEADNRRLRAAVLDHPALRATRTIMLGTRDAQGLYAKFGFVDRATLPAAAWVNTDMVRVG